jgi:hypothetical protein
VVQGSRFRVQGSGFKVQGSGFKVQGSRFRVQGSGFRGSRFKGWIKVRSHLFIENINSRKLGILIQKFANPEPGTQDI